MTDNWKAPLPNAHEIDAVAEAIYLASWPDIPVTPTPWNEVNEVTKDVNRRLATAAIDALHLGQERGVCYYHREDENGVWQPVMEREHGGGFVQLTEKDSYANWGSSWSWYARYVGPWVKVKKPARAKRSKATT